MKFKRIYVEISNLCNVQCSFCPVVERDNKIMSPEQFQGIIRKIKNHTEEICLHLMGEPTAHPELDRILTIAEDAAVKVNLTTNGLLIKRKESLFFDSTCIRQINFSLQSFKDNFPHKPLSDYLMPIMNFTKELLTRREDIYVNFRLWNLGSSSDDNEDIFTEIENFFEIKINRNTQVENIKSKRIWKKLYLHFDSRFDWPSLNSDRHSEQGRCHGLKSHIGIHADGSVVPCCLDKEAIINLGNLNSNSLEDILNSELATSIRSGFAQNKLVHPLCQGCEYITRFSK